MSVKYLSDKCKNESWNDVFHVVAVLKFVENHYFKGVCHAEAREKSDKLSKKSNSNFNAEHKHNLSHTESKADKWPSNTESEFLAINRQVEWQHEAHYSDWHADHVDY